MSRRDLDLSRNGSLQTLGIPAKPFIEILRGCAPAAALRSFTAVLSTRKSPAFDRVLFLYEKDFYNDALLKNTQNEVEDEKTWYLKKFKVFYGLVCVGGFRLGIVTSCEDDDVALELRRAAAVAMAKGR